MKVKKVRIKRFAIGLLLAVLFGIVVIGLGMSDIKKTASASFDIEEQLHTQVLRYYAEIDNEIAVTDDLEKFLDSVDEDTPIQVVFELSYEPQESLTDSLAANAASQEVDRAISRQREKNREFFTARNLDFLREKGFCLYSEDYNLSISYFSPHIIKTFNDSASFEAFSSDIENTQYSDLVYRVSISEVVEFEDRATTQAPENAPRYLMENVRRDIGIRCNTFTGRGISVGMIEGGTPEAHVQLNGVTIHRGGRNNQDGHAMDVARTFVGSSGIALGVTNLHSFAAQNSLEATVFNAMNWLLEAHRNIRVVNVSWGPRIRNYDWIDAFFDFHARHSNVTFVVAAGNGGTNHVTERGVQSPANGFNVITVGSTNANGNVGTYSSYGVPSSLRTRKPTLVAPGTWLETTSEGAACCSESVGLPSSFGCYGTSFAAPIVAGVVARLMEEFPALRINPAMVKAVLIASATRVPGQAAESWSNIAGAGRVHYERAREAARNATGFSHNSRESRQRIASRNINVFPGTRIRVVAFWQINSRTHDPDNNWVVRNSHTDYDMEIRGTNSASKHNSNIQILWHGTVNQNYTIDIHQSSYRDLNNEATDIGAIAWVYDSFPSDGLIIENNTLLGFLQPSNFDGRVRIPENVTSISANAFRNVTDLREINIPFEVTSIGASAFEGCTNLETVSFVPRGRLNAIGANAFRDCRNLSSILITQNVHYIEDGAFAGCQSLVIYSEAQHQRDTWNANWNPLNRPVYFDVRNTNFVTIDGAQYLFSNYNWRTTLTRYTGTATSLTVPTNVIIDGQARAVTHVGDFAFAGRTNLTNLTLPFSVRILGLNAFPSNTTVTWQGNFVFTGSTLTRFIGTQTDYGIPLYITTIAEGAFENNTRLTRVVIPNTVTHIENSAFQNTGLVEVVLPNSIVSIGHNAFRNSRSLRSVIIPISVTWIGDGAFQGCTSLESVIFQGISQVTRIGADMFAGCERLTSFKLPYLVTNIGARAFSGCTGLADITIYNTITNIGAGAFAQWTQSQTIYVRDRDVAPGGWSGWLQNSDATVVWSYALPAINLDTRYLNFNASTGIITGICTIWRAENPHTRINVIIPDRIGGIPVVGIANYAFANTEFRNNRNIVSVTLGRYITSIENHAFVGCLYLQSVTFNAGLTSIGSYAFADTALREITLPDSLTTLGNDAFANCRSLETVNIGSGLTEIRHGTFAYTNALRNVNFHADNKVASISTGVFRESGIQSITLPNGLTTIADTAFKDARSLSEVILPQTLTHIGNFAFQNNVSLARITFPISLRTIGRSAFEGTNLTGASITMPSRPGYTFVGWSNGSVIYTNNQLRTLTGGPNLTATWRGLNANHLINSGDVVHAYTMRLGYENAPGGGRRSFEIALEHGRYKLILRRGDHNNDGQQRWQFYLWFRDSADRNTFNGGQEVVQFYNAGGWRTNFHSPEVSAIYTFPFSARVTGITYFDEADRNNPGNLGSDIWNYYIRRG
jgi:uncharacterized repeat protein (TIGR02543 family)